MIGGTVIDTLVLADKVWINVQDKAPSTETCAIYVDKEARALCVSEGDMIWWQGGYALWTPKKHRVSCEESERLGHKCGIHYEIKLKRRGFSGVGRPKEETVTTL